MTNPAFCHKMVKEVAMSAAGELYETLMGDNRFYEEWKRQNPDVSAKVREKRFIEKNWGKCLEFARTTLTIMLRDPNVAESLKEEIFDALTKDALLVRGRPERQKRVFGKVMN